MKVVLLIAAVSAISGAAFAQQVDTALGAGPQPPVRVYGEQFDLMMQWPLAPAEATDIVPPAPGLAPYDVVLCNRSTNDARYSVQANAQSLTLRANACAAVYGVIQLRISGGASFGVAYVRPHNRN